MKNKSTQKDEKIFCANCIHCKLIRIPVGSSEEYQLRVRCAAGKWKKKMGDEKLYKYFTVARRSQDDCDSYEPLGDTKEYIKDLRKTLPVNDEVYAEK